VDAVKARMTREVTIEATIVMMIEVTIETMIVAMIDGTTGIRSGRGNLRSLSMAMMRVMEDGTVAARAGIATSINEIVTIPLMERFMARVRGHVLADITGTAFMDPETSTKGRTPLARRQLSANGTRCNSQG